MVIAIDETETTRMVNLVLDASERLIGIEVLSASSRLPVVLIALESAGGASEG